MRARAERSLSLRAGFVSVDGSAEATGLPDVSIDLVTAAQSLHWFDPLRSRAEFARILRPGGGVAALWNERRRGTPFLFGLNVLLCAMQADVGRERSCYDVSAAAIAARFFGGSPHDYASVPHQHWLERQRFIGRRVMSSSFAPIASHSHHADWRAAFDALFERHAEEGVVLMEYDTIVVYGVLD
jgi:SAM-dependent methyltransferase